MKRVSIKPEMLRWARERAGRGTEELQGRFAKLTSWESGEIQPTLKQLEAFAKAVHVPFGYLFLPEPPDEPLPIPDFRTVASRSVERPSPNLLDTIYACQNRQSWYQDYMRITRQPELTFVGSATLQSSPETVAQDIRETLGYDLNARRACSTWSDALRLFLHQADKAGILVMVSGVVLNNNKRTLDVEEFRGFALADPLAPLVFINGTDTKAAQMFTLAHELAHLWLGSSALSNVERVPDRHFPREEVWCNQVAAELLVPLSTLRPQLRIGEQLGTTLSRLARFFKVSSLVILRRLLDVGYIDRSLFDETWGNEITRLRGLSGNRSGGGNFYRTTIARVSPRFAQAVVVSTLEGGTLYRDAFRMLGVSKTKTFNTLGREVGVML